MTDGRLARVPNQPKTPQRTIRIPDDLWLPAQQFAEEDGQTASDVVRACLERYVKRKRRTLER
jgi:predicted transcriptional regulator